VNISTLQVGCARRKKNLILVRQIIPCNNENKDFWNPTDSGQLLKDYTAGRPPSLKGMSQLWNY
jgi:hypothetical protein